MKKAALLLMQLGALSAMAETVIIAGWDFEQGINRDLPSLEAPGVARATFVQDTDPVTGDPLFDEFGDPIMVIDEKNTYLSAYQFDGKNGSEDETWGNVSVAPTPRIHDGENLTVFRSTKFRADDGSLIQDVTVKLLPGAEYNLETLHLDYLIPFNASPRDLVVSYISGLDDVGPITLFSLADSVKVTTMTGLDINLADFLTDLTLVGEETVVFRIDFTDSDKTGASFVDNIALVGNGSAGTVDWAGYPWEDESGDVDTGNFIGWINVANGNFVWSYDLTNWLYCPEDHVTDDGAWMFVAK